MNNETGESASKKPRLEQEEEQQKKVYRVMEVEPQNNHSNIEKTILIVKYKENVPIPEQQAQIMNALRQYAQQNNMNMTTIMVPKNEQEK
jgi:acetolactate synthase small subunit